MKRNIIIAASLALATMAYQLSAGVGLVFIIFTAIIPFVFAIVAGSFVIFGSFCINEAISKDKEKIRKSYSDILLIGYIFSIFVSVVGLVFIFADKTSETPVYAGLGLFLITSIIKRKITANKSVRSIAGSARSE